MLNIREVIRQYLPTHWRKNWIITPLGAMLAKLLRQREINTFLNSHKHLKGYDFIDEVLDYFEFSYQASARDKEAIPATGRCIIIANHPLGGLDGLALLHMVLNVRADVRIVANELLGHLQALDEYLLPINNLSGETSHRRMAAISRCLEEEKAVIIFPAGEVSRTEWLKVRDRPWGKGFYLFAKRCNADIVPVFISGRNSFWFYAVSKINGTAAMLLLPRQMWRQRHKVITLKVGTPLNFSLLKQLPVNDKQKIKMLRKHVYQLGKNRKGLFAVPDPVAHPERRSDLRLAVNACQTLGRDTKDQRIVLFEPSDNSPLMREIGRLRELTFRQVGEGSSRRRDLDRYDSYYDHLIIWNDTDLEIMGAYRLASAKKIIKKSGLSGLYSDSLFDYQGDLAWLDEGLELGRSFVQPRYWGSRSLDYLWQGIGAYYVRHPQTRYLFGTVSISGDYPSEAVDYLVAFFRHYFGGANLAESGFAESGFAVKAKTPYVLSPSQQQRFNKLFADTDKKAAYRVMKQHLREMNLSVPTLFKHYSTLCQPGGVLFADFGIDAEFNHCIDGFVIVDLQKIRANKYTRYIAPFLSKKDAQPMETSSNTSSNSESETDTPNRLDIASAVSKKKAFANTDSPIHQADF